MKVFLLEVIIVDNINLDDIKELDDNELVQAYEEVDKYLKYLKDSIIDETANEETEGEA